MKAYIKARWKFVYLFCTSLGEVRSYAFYSGIFLGVASIIFNISWTVPFILLTFLSIFNKKLLWMLLGIVLISLSIQQKQSWVEEVKAREGEVLLTKVFVREDGKFGEYSQQLVVKSELLPGLTMIKVPKYPQYFAGDVLLVKAKIQTIKNSAKSNFDFVKYSSSQSIFSELVIQDINYIEQSGTIFSLGSNVRKYVTNLSRKNLLEPESSLFTGLVIGTESGFNEELLELMKVSGTTHLVVVSGSNFGLLILIIFGFAGALPRRLIYLLTPLLLFMYLIVVGVGNIPALRAMLMASIVVVGLFIGRKSSILNALTLAVVLMLIENPFVIYDVSFQLSVSALMGIVLFQKRLTQLIAFRPLKEVMSGTLAAIISTYPFSVASFNAFGILSLVTNAILIPLIGVISLVSMSITIVSGVMFIPQNNYLVALMNLPLNIVIKIISFFGNLQGVYIQDQSALTAIFITFLCVLFYADYQYWSKSHY